MLFLCVKWIIYFIYFKYPIVATLNYILILLVKLLLLGNKILQNFILSSRLWVKKYAPARILISLEKISHERVF